MTDLHEHGADAARWHPLPAHALQIAAELCPRCDTSPDRTGHVATESRRALIPTKSPTIRYTTRRQSAHARVLADEVAQLGTREVLDREVVRLSAMDEREACARLLEIVGRTREGARVRRCGMPALVEQKWCRSRYCPTCARAIEMRNRRRAMPVIAAMNRPERLVLRVGWCSLLELRGAVTKLWASLRVLKRRRVMRGASAVLGLHPKLADDGRGWNVHAHAVIDGSVVDAAAIVREWSSIVGQRAQSGVPVLPRAERDVSTYREASVAYATRRSAWCPRPGEMPVAPFAVLHSALFGRRLFAVWRGAAALPGSTHEEMGR